MAAFETSRSVTCCVREGRMTASGVRSERWEGLKQHGGSSWKQKKKAGWWDWNVARTLAMDARTEQLWSRMLRNNAPAGSGLRAQCKWYDDRSVQNADCSRLQTADWLQNADCRLQTGDKIQTGTNTVPWSITTFYIFNVHWGESEKYEHGDLILTWQLCTRKENKQ